jgi:ankyrin repeat protein
MEEEDIDPAEQRLYDSVHEGDLDGCIEAIKSGASVDYQKYDGYTPLHIAAQEGHIEVVRALLKHNPDADIQTNDHDTALLRAVRKGNSEIVDMLLNYGASLRIKEVGGDNAAHIAVSFHRLETLKIVIKHSKDILNDQNDRGETPLHTSVEEGRKDFVDLITKQDINLDLKTHNDGETALHIAAFCGKATIAKLLLERGANYTLHNTEGKTPLDEAISQNHEMCVDILEETTAKTFEMMAEFKEETKNMEARIGELQMEHDRALKHARQVYHLQSNQHSHTYKVKLQDSINNLTNEHEREMGALKKRYEESSSNDQLVIRALKAEIEEMQEEFSVALNEAAEHIAKLENDANGGKESALQAELEHDYEIKLQQAKDNFDAEVQKHQNETGEVMERHELTVKALQGQNTTLEEKLKAQHELMASDLEKKRNEMIEQASSYDASIEKLNAEIQSLQNDIEGMKAAQQEEKQGWDEKVQYAVKAALEKKRLEHDKNVSELTQAHASARSALEDKIDKLKEQVDAKAAQEATLASTINAIEENKTKDVLVFQTEREALKEEIRALKLTHLNEKQKRAFNLFNRYFLKVLNGAFRSWVKNATERQHAKEICARAVRRAKYGRLEHSIHKWVAYTNEQQHQRNVIRTLRNKILNRSVYMAFDGFKRHLADQKHRTQRLSHLIFQRRKKTISVAFHQLVAKVNQASKRKYIIQIFYDNMYKLGARVMLGGMNKWKEYTAKQRHEANILQTFVCRWKRSKINMLFQQWRSTAQQQIVDKRLMERATARIRSIELHRVFNGWLEYLERRAHARRVMFRVLNMGKRGGTGRKKEQAWTSWMSFLTESKIMEVDEARCAQQRQDRQTVVHRAIRAFKNIHIRNGMRTWATEIANQKRFESITRSVCRKVMFRTKHKIFQQWHTSVAEKKHNRHTIKIMETRMRNTKLFSAFSTWDDFSQRRARLRRLVSRCIHQFQHGSMQKAFLELLRNAEEERKQVEKMKTQRKYTAMVQTHAKRTMIKLVQRKLAQAFHTWQARARWLVRSDALRSKVLSRLKAATLGKSMLGWQAFLNRRDKARSFLKRILGGKAKLISEQRLQRGVRCWQNFVNRAKREENVLAGQTQTSNFRNNVVRAVLGRFRSKMLATGWKSWQNFVTKKNRLLRDKVYRERILRAILRRITRRHKWRAMKNWVFSTVNMQRKHNFLTTICGRWNRKYKNAAFRKWVYFNAKVAKKVQNRIAAHRLAKKVRAATEEMALCRTKFKEERLQFEFQINAMKKKMKSSDKMSKALLKVAHEGLFDNADIGEHLLKEGADINYRNKYGNSPLHIAAAAGSMRLVSVLLKHGAKVGLVDYNGKTPLEKAIRNGHNDVADILLRNGAKNYEEKGLFLSRR